MAHWPVVDIDITVTVTSKALIDISSSTLKYCENILTRGGRYGFSEFCLFLEQKFLLRRYLFSWATGLLHFNVKQLITLT